MNFSRNGNLFLELFLINKRYWLEILNLINCFYCYNIKLKKNCIILIHIYLLIIHVIKKFLFRIKNLYRKFLTIKNIPYFCKVNKKVDHGKEKPYRRSPALCG